MRTITIGLSGLLMAAAAVNAQDTPPPAWIDVPLSDNTFQEYGDGYRNDVVDIPIGPGGALEYKLGIKAGDAIVYRWDVVEIEDPEQLYSEFHGHTERVGDEPGTVMFYRKASGGTESGALIAPFSGIHGWYLVNSSDAPVVVRLQVAGFYELLEQ